MLGRLAVLGVRGSEGGEKQVAARYRHRRAATPRAATGLPRLGSWRPSTRAGQLCRAAAVRHSGCRACRRAAGSRSGGPLLYLNADGRLDAAVAATAIAGGTVLQPKHSIGPDGYRAIVLDTEGNRIALYSR